MEILLLEWAGNSLREYLIALVIVVASLTVMRILRNMLIARLRPIADTTKTQLDDLAANLLQSTRSWFLFGMSFYIGIRSLDMPESADDPVSVLVLFITLLQVATWSN